MALNCKICDKTMNAMNSVRCKKCRRLVCSSCISDKKTEEGDICLDCAKECKAQSSSNVSQSGAESNSYSIFASIINNPVFAKARAKLKYVNSHASYFVFGCLLVFMFLMLVFMPRIKAKYYRYKLGSENQIEAESAVQALMKNPGESVEKEMLLELEYGNDKTRISAMRVLGEIGSVKAISQLHGIIIDSKEKPEIKSYAQETIIKIQEY